MHSRAVLCVFKGARFGMNIDFVLCLFAVFVCLN